ncbi:MAG: metallophosphoesterase [Clostridia bacterium]|nr:metallophosphoesterase [Clostridia bacterium]
MEEKTVVQEIKKEKPAKAKKAKSKKRKIVKGIFLGLLAVIVVFFAVTTVITVVSQKANIEKAHSFAAVEYENQLQPEKDANGYWTFTVDRDFKVLQLTDVHIGGGWMSAKKDGMAMNAVAAMVTAEKPDLVIVTGDVGYPVPFQAGTLNNKLSAEVFAELMESLGVYWTLGFGNHDTEAYSYFSREKIADFYLQDKYAHCLFEFGPEEVDGCGNQVINVKNSEGIVTQSLFVFDSHSYVDGDFLGIMWKYDNIHENQVQWYKDTLAQINSENNEILKEKGLEENSAVKSAAFFHIPLTEQKDAWYEYVENGFKDTEEVKYHYGVAGESGKIVYSGIHEDNLFETMVELGSTQAVFCGHDHYNNFSIEYKGIRLTYGMSVDYLAYPGIYKEGSQRGCTVIEFSPDGSFDCHPESYYQEKYTALYEKEPVQMQEITQQQFVEK